LIDVDVVEFFVRTDTDVDVDDDDVAGVDAVVNVWAGSVELFINEMSPEAKNSVEFSHSGSCSD
jgi:hypothetical protein